MKRFVKHQKDDAAYAKAIYEAALRSILCPCQ